jgi:hypothetical protein
LRLALASFFMLFVELALIRWITANNVYVTEATNFVLLASFLGIGIGFLNAAAGRDLLRWTPPAFLALVAFVIEFPVILHSPSAPLPVVPRFLAASALAFAPVYIANLVFAQRFAAVETSGTAFAANLLGAMVGGMLEYLALITGYQFLLIVIAVLYGLAFLTGRRRAAETG